MCKGNKFTEAISILAIVNKLSNNLPMEAIKNLVDSLLDYYSEQSATVTCHTGAWSCVFCSSVLEDPVTLICGHSCCKKCMLRDVTSVCKKCKVKYTPVEQDPIDVEPYVKVNVSVSELVNKYWSRELEATRLRAEGNRLFQRECVEDSIRKYGEAIELCPDDYLSLSNRSNALYQDRQYTKSLEDAEKSVELKPDWSKSYFRVGMALAALHRYEEAVAVFFQCFVLEDKCSKVLKTELVKAMYKIINRAETDDRLPNASVRSSAKFSSHPNLIHGANRATRPRSEASDGESDYTETDSEVLSSAESKMVIVKNKRLSAVLNKVEEGVKKTISIASGQSKSQRHIDPEKVEEVDFQCTVCLRLLWQPVTTPCGHTYCRACIDNYMDHKQECPMCRTALLGFQKSNTGITEFIEATIKRMLPLEYRERQRIHEDEMNELLGFGNVIPVFICTMSFPNVPCPLHVFEARYRLMIRRVMESGTRQFGMCVASEETGFSDYGTMLEIRDIEYFNDGRSVVDTIGGKRFRVLSRGAREGYHTAKVEYLQDEAVEGDELEGLKNTHEKIRALAEIWFSKMDPDVKRGILAHYGDMPGLEHEYWRLGSGPAWCWWVLAIMPLDQVAQQQILSNRSLRERLTTIERILGFMKKKGAF